MPEAKHTPGPWLVDLDREFILGGDTVSVEAMTPDGRHVEREVASLMLDTDDHPDGPGWLEDAANARLIAAAPDLLAACETTLAKLDYLRNLWGDEGVTRGVADALRAAIAKAEGSPP